MILLLQSSDAYNNDIRAMLMAFFPGVKIVERQEEGQSYIFTFKVNYDDSHTRLCICDGLSMNDDSTGLRIEPVIIDGDYRDKSVFRNKLKMASYRLLSFMEGRSLPWGDLTGVRPTKIAMSILKAGKSREDTIQNYIDVYEVSEKKAMLATDVAMKELSLTSDIDLDNDYCLYIGIPFCPSRCLYCSFTSYPIERYRDRAGQYIDKVCEELSFVADAYRNKNLIAIYIGGGTPTSITPELLDRMLVQIENVFDLTKLREFTVEAGRPDSITLDKLKVLKHHGVTRISINPQTMNDETLRTIGRAHTASQTVDAFHMARQEGFDNINMDLIAGLPNENIDSMRHTLQQIRKLGPESITVHSLAIKRAANLKHQMSEYGDMINRDMNEMLDMVSDEAGRLGMEPYYLYRQKNIGGNLENVGYSKQGLECLYNILIMEELTDIVAVGAGASTKLTYHSENRVERVENCKSVDDYIDRFDEMLDRKKKFRKEEI